MNPTPRRLATAVAAGLTVLALGAAPALDDSQSHQDPRGDVEKLDLGTKGKASIDLVRARNEYRGGTLSLSSTGAKLPKKGYIAAWIITAETGTYQLVADHTQKKVLVDFAQLSGRRTWAPRSVLRRGGDCPAAKVKVKDDVVTGSVPRSCLDDADAVRIASIVIEPVSASTFKVDDARQKGYDAAGGPKFGPRLDRN